MVIYRTGLFWAMVTGVALLVACGPSTPEDEQPCSDCEGSGGGGASVMGAGAATSAGGTSGLAGETATGGTSPGSGGSSEPDLETQLLDDFEEASTGLFWSLFQGRVALLDEMPPVATWDGRTAIASQGKAQGVRGLAADLERPSAGVQRLAVDLSEWDGIQFWVRGAFGTQDLQVEVEIVPTEDVQGGGTCQGTCGDSFAVTVPMESSWQLVRVAFDSLAQGGWGVSAGEFSPEEVLGFVFRTHTFGDWHFAIDELALYRGATGDQLQPLPPLCSEEVCVDTFCDESNGSITWYTFDQGTDEFGDVNCSYGIEVGSQGDGDRVKHVHTGGGAYFGAIATANYDEAAACGACVEVSRPSQGKSVTVTIVDRCPVETNPKCVEGHIDLSKAAFRELGTEAEGYLGQRAGTDSITWRYVPCPVEGPATMRLKEPSNQFWNAIVVENHPLPIERVEVLKFGTWIDTQRQDYNFWLPPSGKMGSPPYRVRATDANGSVIEATLELEAGSQGQGEQFVCSAIP